MRLSGPERPRGPVGEEIRLQLHRAYGHGSICGRPKLLPKGVARVSSSDRQPRTGVHIYYQVRMPSLHMRLPHVSSGNKLDADRILLHPVRDYASGSSLSPIFISTARFTCSSFLFSLRPVLLQPLIVQHESVFQPNSPFFPPPPNWDRLVLNH